MTEVKQLNGVTLIFAFVAVCLGTFIYVLDYSVANVAIPYISGDLAVSNVQGTYVITSFAVGNAIAIPATDWLSKRIGMSKLLWISIALFTLLSLFCGLSQSILMLVALRFFQGVSAGPLTPLSQTFIAKMFPANKSSQALGFYAMIVVVAPVLGPIIGGYICINYHWGWIFFINIPIGIFSAIVVFLTLRRVETPIIQEPLDTIGLLLLAVGVTALQILLDKGEQWNWFTNQRINILSVVSFVCLFYLIIHSLTYKKPFLNLSLFKVRSFAVACIILSIGYSLYFGTVVLVPLWLQTYMGYEAFWAGLCMAPVGIVPIFTGIFVGKLMDRIGKVPLLVTAFLFIGLSCYFVRFFTPQIDFFYLAFSRFILGIGLSFFITPLFSMAISDLQEADYAMGMGIFQFMRSLFGGIGTSFYTTLWSRRIRHQHLNLVSHFTPYEPQAVDYVKDIKNLGIDQNNAILSLVNQTVDQQASVFAICEIFWLMGTISLGLIVVCLFAYSRRSSQNRVLTE